MTDTGRRQQMGDVAEELVSLRGHLACLVKKAERSQGARRDAVKQLDSAIGDNKSGEDRSSCDRQTWPTYDEIASLFKDITEAKNRIRQLEDQFREWGVIR